MVLPMNLHTAAFESISKRILDWWFETWTDPWMWVVLGVSGVILMTLGSKPISVPKGKEEVGPGTYVAVFLRQLSIWLIVSLPAVTTFVFVVGLFLYDARLLLEQMLARVLDRFSYWWELPTCLWLGSMLATFALRRYVMPKVSAS